MRFCILFLMFLMPISLFADMAGTQQSVTQDKGILIRNIVMEGFELQDKSQFVKLFKPYRNKYLTTSDMDGILQKIQVIYEREGYQDLVNISYQVNKHQLVFTALMTT